MPFSVRVAEVMDRNVVLIDSDRTMMDAIRSMVEHNAWSLVVTKQGIPLGVVTDRDVLRRCLSKGLDAGQLKVELIMSSPLITVRADTTLGEEMSEMVTREVRRLYIVENDVVVGRITQTSLLGNILVLVELLSTVTS